MYIQKNAQARRANVTRSRIRLLAIHDMKMHESSVRCIEVAVENKSFATADRYWLSLGCNWERQLGVGRHTHRCDSRSAAPAAAVLESAEEGRHRSGCSTEWPVVAPGRRADAADDHI